MIRVEGLGRSWGDFQLEDIRLDLASGCYCAVVGPCGSGKSLLLETIAGLHPPHRGKVSIDGTDVSRLAPERRRLGYVPQRASIFPHMSVRRNISYAMRYHGVRGAAADERVAELIGLLRLERIADRRAPRSLSGGEAQKVVLARALAISPAALLLDEPLGSLDYQSSQEVTAALKEINRQLDVSVIHVTHDYTEAASLADTVAVMHEGRMVQVGSVEDVFWRPATQFVARFVGIENIIRGESDGNGRVRVGEMSWAVHAGAARGPCVVTVRPRDVIAGPDAMRCSNRFAARVQSMSDEGFSLRIELACGAIQLVSSVAKQGDAGRDMRVGAETTVGFEAVAAHVIGAEEG